jgi:hypothetical protein
MRLRSGLAGLLAVAIVLLGGCGGSSSKASGTAATTAPAGTSSPPTQSSPSPTSAAPSSSAVPPTTVPAATSADFDSCSVVTQPEAAAAIGSSVSPGVLGSATVEGGLACVFYGPSAPAARDPNVGQPDTVRVVVVKGSDALKWYEDYQSKVPAQNVAGFGDQAYYDGYASLSVLTGDVYLRVAVSPAGAAPSLNDEKELASAILPKL